MFVKVPKDFLSKRLTATNVRKYLQATYNFGDTITEVARKTLSVPVFLQNNYGKDGDCTLTSILTLTKFYNREPDTNAVYDFIEATAEKFLYDGDTIGTIPFFNKAIVKRTFKQFNINKTINTRYGKGIGFNLETIMNLIDQNTPVMISICQDGRKYYDSHTITIIGYVVYEDENRNKKVMLQVYDNWFSSYSYLDYTPLSLISMICY